jgi:hypothetical protein
MTALLALLPAVVLLIGALVSLLPIPAKVRNLVSFAAYIVSAASVLIVARLYPDPVTIATPSDVLPMLTLTLGWNAGAVPLGLFLLAILAARPWIGFETDPPSLTIGTLVTAAGALVFLAADNWTMVAAAWLGIEFGLLVVPADENPDRDTAARAFGWNLAALVAWLAAGIILSNEGSTLRLQEVSLQGTAALLVLLALWIRSGLYPFQAAAPANSPSLGVRLGIPLLVGSYLMTRLLLQSSGPIRYVGVMQILALLAVGISALLVVGQPHGVDSFTWVVRALGAPLLVLPFLIRAELAPALALGLGIGAFAASNLLSVALQWRAQTQRLPLTMLLWIIALVVVSMLPLAPAFWSRVGFLAGAYAEGRLTLWLVLVATLALVLIPLWRELYASRDIAPKVPSRSEYVGLAVLLVPMVAFALSPFLWAAPFGQAMQDSATRAVNAVFRPVNMPTLIFTVAGMIIPLLASWELARRWDRRANLVPQQVTAVLDLSGFVRALDFVYRLGRAVMLESMALLEQPPVAWLIFLAIWVAVWLRGI